MCGIPLAMNRDAFSMNHAIMSMLFFGYVTFFADLSSLSFEKQICDV